MNVEILVIEGGWCGQRCGIERGDGWRAAPNFCKVRSRAHST
jgi:hypothetical protein